MHERSQARKQISWHLKDLLARDLRATQDVIAWLTPVPSEVSNRYMPKRLMARLQAAVLLTNALKGENSGLLTHILDRTEGKVAEPGRGADRPLLALHINLGHTLGTSEQQVIEITPGYQLQTDGESNVDARPAELAPALVVEPQAGQAPGLPLIGSPEGPGGGGDGIPLPSAPDTVLKRKPGRPRKVKDVAG